VTGSAALVSVCRVDLTAEAAWSRRYERLLSPEERERAARFQVADAYTEFVVTRAVLRLLLGEHLGCSPWAVRIEVSGPGAKPRVADLPAVQFSVSHTRGLALVAYGEGGPVGVDAECLDCNVDAELLASRCLTADELRTFQRLPQHARPRAFLTAWTRKEAVLKAQGVGLAGDLRQVEVGLGTGDVAPRGRGQGWRLRELESGPRHLAALAVRRDRSVTVREFSWSKR
jgi:4'-phosphopantetheinyl transferase